MHGQDLITPDMTDTVQRILDLSLKYKLSHLSGVLTAVDIIDDMYKVSDNNIISCGHVGLALYVVLEKYHFIDAEQLLLDYGIHPTKDKERFIMSSGGSLGHGIGIALGYAISEPYKSFYCLISDGEYNEGSIHEALEFINRRNVKNVHVLMNYNGLSAYGFTRKQDIPGVRVVDTSYKWADVCSYVPELGGLAGHYQVCTQDIYDKLVRYYECKA